MRVSFFYLFIVFFFFTSSALPCSSFRIPGTQNVIFAKSYDWKIGNAYLLVNKRNVYKKSLSILSTDQSLEWMSDFGSLTFNQYGQEFPLGGINEMGLAIEILWLETSIYPKPDQRSSLNELQWIQYHLDTAANVREMIENAKKIRVSKVHANVHYLACDANESCATFEYVDGKLVVHSNTKGQKSLPYPTITNKTYEESVNHLKQFVGFGGQQPLPSPSQLDPLSRFVKATSLAKAFPQQEQSDFNYAFEILDNIAIYNYSKWNIVYDLNDKVISFKTRFGFQQRKKVTLTEFHFSCKTPVVYFDVESNLSGDVTNQFKNYSFSRNKSLVLSSMSGKEYPARLKPVVYNYPQTTECRE